MPGLLSLPLDVARDVLAAPGQFAGLLGSRPARPSASPGVDADAQAVATFAPPIHPVRSVILGTLLPSVEAQLEQNEARKFAAARNLAIYRSLPTAEAKAAFWMDPEGFIQQWRQNVGPPTSITGQAAAPDAPT
jgi:hypothetical protein